MRRYGNIALGLLAVVLLAATQSMPRLLAICQRPCGPSPVCAAERAVTPPPSPGCCADRGAEPAPCAPVSPCESKSGRECRRQPMPCDQCLTTEVVAEAPRASVLKRPLPAPQPALPAPAVYAAHDAGAFHGHSPPGSPPLGGAERCLRLCVLLI